MRPRLRRSDGALREGEVERWFRKEERLGGGEGRLCMGGVGWYWTWNRNWRAVFIVRW